MTTVFLPWETLFSPESQCQCKRLINMCNRFGLRVAFKDISGRITSRKRDPKQRDQKVTLVTGGVRIMKNRKGNQKGFSLIELLLVVAIILIIAAIAIPNLLQARMAANEASAVASLRTVNMAMISYNDNYPTVGYAPTLAPHGGALGAACVPSSTTAC